jgi:hypothetical protein
MLFCYMFKEFCYHSQCSISFNNFQAQNRVGIEQRCDLGFLLWDKNSSRTSAFNIGSRLKTPVLPLWVTRCNDVIGILFNPNKELLRSHNAEKRFLIFSSHIVKQRYTSAVVQILYLTED